MLATCLMGCRNNFGMTGRVIILPQISNPGMLAFNILAEIKHDTGKEVNDKRETYCQKRGVDKKQSYF
jgi:hypothetical protein